jgi:hypothetical protein
MKMGEEGLPSLGKVFAAVWRGWKLWKKISLLTGGAHGVGANERTRLLLGCCGCRYQKRSRRCHWRCRFPWLEMSATADASREKK